MKRARKPAPLADFRQRGLRAGGEFALIDSFLQPFHLAREARQQLALGILAGPGDDCAALRPGRGMALVATTDAAVEGVHFDLRYGSPADAGWKALAMNLSDLAAAGAKARWFLCALGVPATLEAVRARRQAGAFGRGMAQLARQSGCALVGGNVTRSPVWSLTITALGEAKRPLSRAGARPGDRLVLVGEPGAAALGLELLRASTSSSTHASTSTNSNANTNSNTSTNTSTSTSTRTNTNSRALTASERAAIRAQLRPRPQLEAGLLAAPLASAAIDISDGLLQDLAHLCARSGCGAVLEMEHLPRSKAVRAHEERERAQGGPAQLLSLTGGEAYALLLAVRPSRLAALRKACRGARVIGEVVRAPLGAREPIELRDGARRVALPSRRGFQHFD